jgi:hypothetical protein
VPNEYASAFTIVRFWALNSRAIRGSKFMRFLMIRKKISLLGHPN